MDEQQQLDLVDDAFNTFRAGGPLVHPVGAGAARATVKHRRRVRILAATTAAAIAVMIPAAGYATGFFGAKGPPPVPGSSTEPSVAPSSSESPPAGTPSLTPAAPDGRISATELSHATVTLGGRPGESVCRAKTFTFHGSPTMGDDGNGGTSIRYTVEKVINVDFDHDGALETLAQINCSIQGHDTVVLALDKDPNGKILTVGQVVATGANSPVKSVFDLRADPNGAVGIQVGDRGVCCATSEEMVEHQWRSYSFDGTTFTQTGGRTSFTPVAAPTDLGVTMTGLTLGKPVSGVRKGTVTVTVTNHGSKAAPGAVITVSVGGSHGLPGSVQIATDLHDCSSTRNTSASSLDPYESEMIKCHLFGFKVGESRSFTFRVTSSTANDPTFTATPNPNGAGSSVAIEQPGVRLLDTDTNGNNDYADSTITLS